MPAHARLIRRSILLLVLVASFLVKLHHLDHAALKGLDESCHAVVAKNLLKHPFTPTLIDRPYLPYDDTDWQMNHIWLHKPVLPLWQIALSYLALGITPFALRFPSAILSTASVALTYLIGKRLLSREAGLIAAALQAFLPAITTLVQGYIFSDHVDIAFLFWTELSIYLLARTAFDDQRQWLLLVLTGIATAAAFLSKTYPAFITLLVGFSLLFTTRSFRIKHFLTLVSITIAFVLPWSIWCFVRFRPEFLHENLHIFQHLTSNVENFAAPWDRLVFDYLVQAFGRFYPLVIVAGILLIRTRDAKLIFLYVWALGVVVPYLLATSKTPSATLIAWPATLLLVAELIVRAGRGDVRALAAVFVCALFAVAWRAPIGATGFGYPTPPRFGGIVRENFWVIPEVVAGLLAALFAPKILRCSRCVFFASAVLLFVLFAQLVRGSYRVTASDPSSPAFPKLAALVDANLPDNAVLLFDQREKLESVIAMFWIDRTVYPLGSGNWNRLISSIRANHGIPIIISSRALPIEPLFSDPDEGLIAYDPRGEDLSNFSAIYPIQLPP